MEVSAIKPTPIVKPAVLGGESELMLCGLKNSSVSKLDSAATCAVVGYNGNLTVPAGLTLNGGNLDLLEGQLTIHQGSLTLASGNIEVTSGNFNLSDGMATITGGSLVLRNATLELNDTQVLVDGKPVSSSLALGGSGTVFFSAYKTFTTPAVTGSSQVVQVIADKVIKNDGGGYNRISGDFKAPHKGDFKLSCKVTASKAPARASQVGVWISTGGVVNPNYMPLSVHKASSLLTSGVTWHNVHMEKNQVASCFYQVIGSSQGTSVGIYGAANSFATSFEGSEI